MKPMQHCLETAGIAIRTKSTTIVTIFLNSVSICNFPSICKSIFGDESCYFLKSGTFWDNQRNRHIFLRQTSSVFVRCVAFTCYMESLHLYL